MERFPSFQNVVRQVFDTATDSWTTQSERDPALATHVPDGPVHPGRPASGDDSLPPGSRLGDYEILSELGRGGMGVVYKARHVQLDKLVALKLLNNRLRADSDALARFAREIKALGQLEHPHLVEASDARKADDHWFVVMRYVEGVDLHRLVKTQGPLTIAGACEAVRQAALGLEHVHQRGFVHRDVKPSNLMLAAEGTIKLLDLGLASLRSDLASNELTAYGQPLGTIDYMAPEQARDAASVDGRADVYSLGCTLFHLLAGSPPYPAPKYRSVAEKLAAHIHDPFPDVSALRADVPKEVRELIRQMTAKQPGERIAGMSEVIARLQPFCAGARILAGADTVNAKTNRRPWRRSLLVAGALAAVVCVGLLMRNANRSSQDDPTSDNHANPVVGQPVGATTPTAEPVRILWVEIEHIERREGPDIRRGVLGSLSFNVKAGDLVRLHATLSEPAYCYWIAFRPDGEEEVCFPENADEPPAQTDQPSYPSIDPMYSYELTDGAGLQAFALVVSREPLPAYNRWLSDVPASPWVAEVDSETTPAEAGVIYRHDGQKLYVMTFDDGTRGKGRETDVPRSSHTQERRTWELASWLAAIQDVDAVEVWTFEVPERAFEDP
jgi:serine/threonine protein kinase